MPLPFFLEFLPVILPLWGSLPISLPPCPTAAAAAKTASQAPAPAEWPPPPAYPCPVWCTSSEINAAADKCPVGAIPVNLPSETDYGKCISCMRCTSICPQNARNISKTLLTAGSMKMKKACSGHKINELFI